MDNTNQPNFVIQKIFTKDISFEAPNTPAIFTEQWQPDAKVNVNTKSTLLEENVHEVELTLTVDVKNANKTAYLIEITQSGIFTIENMPDDQVKPMLGAFCPTTLFPYAKEAIDSAVNKAGFPQSNINPVNFDALYMQKVSSQQKENTDTKH